MQRQDLRQWRKENERKPDGHFNAKAKEAAVIALQKRENAAMRSLVNADTPVLISGQRLSVHRYAEERVYATDRSATRVGRTKSSYKRTKR